MKPGAKIFSAIELLENIWESNTSAPAAIQTYFKLRRFAGSSDRKSIKFLFYEIIRKRSKLNWWFRQFEPNSNFTARSAVIVYLILEKKYKEDMMLEFFSNKLYHPHCLTKTEYRLLKSIAGNTLSHPKMPDFVTGEYPEWLDPTFRNIWGNKILDETLALNARAPLDLRVNTLKTSREALQLDLLKEGLKTSLTPFSPLGLRANSNTKITETIAYKMGKVEIQDEGSQLISILCNAKPGMRVIDYCAGAGGKSLAIAAIMKNKGHIMACDISLARLKKIRERQKRANIKIISSKVLSSKNYETPKRKPKQADRVLCDVPCSGTGTWRRQPEKKFNFSEYQLQQLLKTQRNILFHAQHLVKPGGFLIYSTCSVLPQENHEQISWFLKTFKNFSIKPINTVSQEVCLSSGCFAAEYLKLSPAATNTDGFFCAILLKMSDSLSPLKA